jgi:RimJ/RimL family protein N-acetyltransferase
MIIRSLTAEDVADYRRLRLESIVNSPTSFFPSLEQALEVPLAEMVARIEPTPLQIFFGAFEEDELIGMAGMLREPHAKTRHAANIFGVYVASTFRAKRVAKNLLEKIISYAKVHPEILQLTLCVNPANPIARSLYIQLGFISTGFDKRRLLVEGQFYDEERMILLLDK